MRTHAQGLLGSEPKAQNKLRPPLTGLVLQVRQFVLVQVCVCLCMREEDFMPHKMGGILNAFGSV